jgi:hypothetical protein
MIFKRQIIDAFARFLVLAAIACSLCCCHTPSLEERITATTSKLKTWQEGKPFPKAYEQEVIALAKEPTEALDEAFLKLEAKRSHAQDYTRIYDEVWLTGTLITILAFDCPPVTSRDHRTWDMLKSDLAEPVELSKLKQSSQNNEMLAEWPWRNERGSWHLAPIESGAENSTGSTDRYIKPRFEYYEIHFKRRRLP